MWHFRKTHSLVWLLHVLVAKIHSSVLNPATLHHLLTFCFILNGYHRASQKAFLLHHKKGKALREHAQLHRYLSNALHCHMLTSLCT